MTLDKANTILDAKWTDRSTKVDWLGLEQFQRDIIESAYILDPVTKLSLIADAIGCWTKRGRPAIGI